MTGAMAGAGAPPDLSLLTLPTAVYALTNFEYNRLKKIKGDKSSRAWLDAVDAILSARGGQLPIGLVGTNGPNARGVL